ncbi:dTDP-4-amino-4,6-dideoxygalactose transaminase [Aromatoleum tolulyticum]|uniref:dTDP-4-amino-4,6-dideoxygalactose transaminase n=1 Tax=Aromatoleum tolulyticum TaxID=34027 RepID=A0A1N6UU53_9RHOO|nr:DegT/DnrJ/EryC1/StrS family aminotransferase [Aromatoleum tolulyticum]SIQ69137.1 dTDP-4-amino-4,6-dideoxygalactose transaminase [Aromatoleum tolulyticum]
MVINDIKAHIDCNADAVDRALQRVRKSGWVILGPEVMGFESAFAQYVGVERCVTVANGTDALEIALRSVGIGSGDRVATVANAGMYATTAMLAIGAFPVFMDVDLESRTASSTSVRRAIDLGARAIIVTHLYGKIAPDIAEIADICRQRQVPLIEDCAQAHGARLDSRMAGAYGDLACFSFYPTKNLGALGDGGAIVTKRVELAEAALRLRQYGWSEKYKVASPGARNSRLDEIQAAVLMELLPRLDAWNQRRRCIAESYSAGLSNPAVCAPECGGADYVAHLYVIRTNERDSLREHLKRVGISTDVHYPVPDHMQPVFGERYSCLELPNTEALAKTVLTLPCYPEMTDADVERVIDAVNRWS